MALEVKVQVSGDKANFSFALALFVHIKAIRSSFQFFCHSPIRTLQL
jgi:hypothetical protein